MRDVNSPNVNVEKIPLILSQFTEKIDRANKEYAEILAQLHQKIAQIVEDPGERNFIK